MQFIFLNIFAGNTFKVTFGTPFDFPEKHRRIESQVLDNGILLEIYWREATDIIIRKFDKDLKLANSNTIDISTLPKDLISKGFYKFGNEYYWLYQTYDKASKTEQLQAVKIDVENSKLIAKPIILLKTDKKIARDFYNYEKYFVRISDDSSKIMFNTARFYPESKDNNINYERRAVAVFDNKLNKIFSSEIKMPYVEASLSILTLKIDNDGNAYIIGKINEAGKKIKDLEKLSDVTHYEILKYGKDNLTTPTIKKIKIKGKYIETFNILTKKNKELIITGLFSDFKKEDQKEKDIKKGIYFLNYNDMEVEEMTNKGFIYFPEDKIIYKTQLTTDQFKRIYYVANYSKKENIDAIDGVFLLRIDNLDNTISSIEDAFFEIPNDVLKAYTKNRESKKIDSKASKGANVGDSYLTFSEVIDFSDSSIALVGEEYYVTSNTVCDSKGNCRTYYTYHYNDIFVGRFDKNLKLIRFVKIPKMQTSGANPGFSSYNIVISDDNLHIFYLDNPENLNIDINTSPKGFSSKGILVASTIDKDGKVTKTKILDLENEVYKNLIITNFMWNPHTGILTGEVYNPPRHPTVPEYKKMSISVN